MDQLNRKENIWAMANNLSLPDFITLENVPVSVGLNKTLLKNLTHNNRQGSADGNGVQVEFINSLTGTFNSAMGPKKINWFTEKQVAPVFFYTDVNKAGGGCNAEILAQDYAFNGL